MCMSMTKKIIIVAALLFGALAGIYSLKYKNQKNAGFSTAPNQSGAGNSIKFDKKAYSLTDPSSPWIVVNKKRPLDPADYEPKDLTVPKVLLRVPGNDSMRLRQEAAKALEDMFLAAEQKGLKIMLASGYRSYAYQTNLYNGYVQSQGQAKADGLSARPGYSEHQTGWGVDIEGADRSCELEACFADKPEGKWLEQNAYKYGWLLRYTPDKVSITGYQSEPWHFRYVGKLLAQELERQNIKTLEEFFGVPGGQAY